MFSTSRVALMLALVAGARAGAQAPVSVMVHDAAGAMLGTLSVQDTKAGLVITGTLTGLPAGTHGIHIHETGKCDAPFTTAGGHLNTGKKSHGFMSAEGWHDGDMMNIETPATGPTTVNIMAPGVKLASVMDADGGAIVVHAMKD